MASAKKTIIWLALLLGAGLHFSVKIMDIFSIEVPACIHLISSAGYITFAILFAGSFLGWKGTAKYLILSLVIITAVLYFAQQREWMRIGSSMLIFNLPIPIVLWFFSLSLNSFIIAADLHRFKDAGKISSKILVSVTASVIAAGYFAVTVPSIGHRQDWQICVAGGYYGISAGFFAASFAVLLCLNLIYTIIKGKTEQTLTGSRPVWIYYTALFALTLFGSSIYGLYNNVMLSFFIMSPFILFRLGTGILGTEAR